MEYKIIRLKDKSLKSLKRRHPWVFSGGILNASSELEEGEKVWVADSKGRILGTGQYGHRSIAVRMLSFEKKIIDTDFYTKKFKNAAETRKLLGIPNTQTTAYRLIHGEGDGLPGLIVDIYDKLAVVQSHSRGMAMDFELIANALRSNLKVDHVAHTSAEKGVETPDFTGIPEEIEFLENGNRFLSNWKKGQKTGFFLDQRDNRHLLGTLSKEKKVLNAFSYTGGFSVYALGAGATEVHSLDSSASALALSEKHVELNGLPTEKHRTIQADALEFFKNEDLSAYDILVIDPPAFAKHRSARHRAVQAYKRLNAAAMKKAKSGSLILTFSCSQVVTPDLFENTITAAAVEVGKNVRVLKHLHQPADHPVSIFHPEGEYLKGLLLKVDFLHS